MTPVSAPPPPRLPTPPRERWPLVVVLAMVLAGLGVLGLALSGAASGERTPQPPAAAPTADRPLPAPPALPTAPPPAVPRRGAPAPEAPAPAPRRRSLDELRFARNGRSHVRASWVAGFYPIYETAARAFGVNWLLIASVHRQETAFSTSPDTYHGLNFANCCAGPMQFNVTNGPLTTWERFRDAHRKARRPASYNHRTKDHPSVYDDFDAIMAAAALLRYAGAGQALDGSAWRAAYEYYGYDLTGVDYASQVAARAIGWARSGFCINCEADRTLVAAADAAWGAPVRAALTAADERRRRAADRKRS